ncbi:MAG: methylenetetrahydrofolate reductase, partial [Candidatus Blochmannia sp. A2]|nr:methylenetetrahydrofolate reductase [Candidatus Blochmannia sp. A2]
VNIPKWIILLFQKLENDLSTQKILGGIVAVELVKRLYSEGVRNFHFYTLNHSQIIYSICHMLRL